ncbi:Uu.00g108630.m01.CDS01 [Anthostomella pinea]|uniref:Uu.00g108630.m01.CDS01 n=1 Tax=Anthostomella pinea TaxID=933095 RepID=A0AAI8VF18_9PEZI|nr:Uu.00g108630.m01.CDS01 [Anthostomella pinea]
MDKFSCSMAADVMEACYKVGFKKLIDDVSVLAIERCLIQKLPHLLSLEVIWDLSDAEVQCIAAESGASSTDRLHATEKLRVLPAGLAELKRMRKHDRSMPDA